MFVKVVSWLYIIVALTLGVEPQPSRRRPPPAALGVCVCVWTTPLEGGGVSLSLCRDDVK